MPNSLTHIAGAALNQTPFDWTGNFNNIAQAIEQARREKVAVLCLPELCISGYGCEDTFLSEWLPAKALEQLAAIIPLCQDITVSVGLPIRLDGLTYNCAALIHNGQLFGITAKRFLANEGVHYEPRWFTAWSARKRVEWQWQGQNYPFGDVIYEVNNLKISFEICEDAWRGTQRPGIEHCEKHGVNLILNPSASHCAFGKTKTREQIVVGGSKDMNCVYVYVNLLGNESGRMIYDGEILIAQNGRLVQRNNRFSYKNVNVVGAPISFTQAEITPVLPLNDDDQDKFTEFAEAVPLALFDYMRKSRSKGFVLSLSGGADSSACAVLVAEMVHRALAELGQEDFLQKINWLNTEPLAGLHGDILEKAIVKQLLTCAYQGTRNSSNDTFASAKNLADSVGALFYNWTIDEEVHSYTHKIENAIGRALTWEHDDIALQNIQARSRSPIIWLLTNVRNALLITTSNRSEGDVGYATMDGDTSGSIAPIAGVDKDFIRHWLVWAEQYLGYYGLNYVNNLAPSAELRPLERVQTDEKDLMPYHILREIEVVAIRDRRSPVEVYEILRTQNLEDELLLKVHIIKFFRLWTRNQWKRERIAPSFHLDDFNVDSRSWCRFPILSGGFEQELKALEQL